ncbi:PilZ domain-containing protein [Vibrio sp. JC009]|uniref:PilZ domain-containing protein n=1 Tax=Vibrio sp. JC009 TaxID=2912314 RepID=UPI0023AF11D1|nr:PilZ domain-containing protein [Vibrio sp. JC009]WED20649.1 PilZ domain-containing protein [Vibrio sp. JC009]
MDQEQWEQKRQFYRLRYPDHDRPIISIMDEEFYVCEISEQGMRIVFVSDTPVEVGVIISGLVTFYDDKSVEVQGTILRQHESEVAVKLIDDGISFRRMTQEQMHLRQKYPGMYGRKKKALAS